MTAPRTDMHRLQELSDLGIAHLVLALVRREPHPLVVVDVAPAAKGSAVAGLDGGGAGQVSKDRAALGMRRTVALLVGLSAGMKTRCYSVNSLNG